MPKTLALVMCVKNEEKGLEKAILSCKDFVNEIVICVDRASNDSTAVIAQKYASLVKFFTFADDFSAMRNYAHEGVKSDFILFLDGHEFVSETGFIKRALESDADAILVNLEMETGSRLLVPRIYKTGLNFAGAIHERVQYKKAVSCPSFVLVHARVGGQNPEAIAERDAQRDKHMRDIMGAQVKADPTNTRASFHMALYWLSRKNLKKARFYQKLFLKHSKLPQERWYMLFNMSLCYMLEKRYWRAFLLNANAENELPGRWETAKLRGMIYLEKKRYKLALDCFARSLDVNRETYVYTPWKREDWQTFNFMGECLYNLRDFLKSSIAFSRASELATDKLAKKFFQDRSDLMRKMYLSMQSKD